jgi:uncharacterized membrane protein YccF (DUF307 family)
MSTIGNIIWIIFGGFVIFLLYLLGSVVLMITIIGIPFGIQTLKIAMLALMPFGKDVQPAQRFSGCLYVVMNIIWILVAGIELAIIHLTLALFFAITIIGIPFALQHLKLTQLALLPFGQDIVDAET